MKIIEWMGEIGWKLIAADMKEELEGTGGDEQNPAKKADRITEV